MMKKATLDTANWPIAGWALLAAILSSLATWWPPSTVPCIATGFVLASANLFRCWRHHHALTIRRSRHQRTASAGESIVGPRPEFDAKLLDEARAHREWLHSSLRVVAWSFSVVLAVGLGFAGWILGDSASAAANTAANRVLDEEKGMERLRAIVNSAMALAESTLPKRAESAVNEAFNAGASKQIADLVASKLKQLTDSSAEQLIRNEVQALVGVAPAGSIVAWPVAIKPPRAWRICNGDELEAKDYPELAALLDATYGAVGPGKFKLPDFRGYFLRGASDDAGLAWGVGKPQGDQACLNARDASGEMQNLQHFIEGAGGYAYWKLQATNGQSIDPSNPPGAIRIATLARKPTPETTPLNFETRPRNYAVHWIIRVK